MAEEKKSPAKSKKADQPKAAAAAAEAAPAQTPAAAERLHRESSREDKHCRETGCKRPYRAKDYCITHYKLWRQGKHGKKQRYKTCSKEGCRKPMGRWGLCDAHVKGSEETASPPAAG